MGGEGWGRASQEKKQEEKKTVKRSERPVCPSTTGRGGGAAWPRGCSRPPPPGLLAASWHGQTGRLERAQALWSRCWDLILDMLCDLGQVI